MRLLRPFPTRASARAGRAALAAPLLLLGACMMSEQSVNVNQSRIWTEYELHYDANRDVTVARAQFRFGSALGTSLELSSPSEVRFNGQLLSRTVQTGTGFVRYERTFAGAVTSGTFRFVDTEDEAYSNTVTLRPVEFPAQLGPIDNDQAHAFEWIGASLARGEEVRVSLWRLSQGDVALWMQRQEGARGMVLDAQQLRNIEAGEVTLGMERSWNGTPARTPDAGGKLVLKWTARDADVVIVD